MNSEAFIQCRVSIATKSALRAANSVVPLPEAELMALRQATRELAAVGRNLNQIARMGHTGGAAQEVGRQNLVAVLAVTTGS